MIDPEEDGMLGEELINFIVNNNLQEYDFVTEHETGEGTRSIDETYISHLEKTVELY